MRNDVNQFEGERDQVDLWQTEGMLTNAGFRQIPADTPQRKAQLLALPPYTLVHRPLGDEERWVYADAAECTCLYVGNSEAYRRFRSMGEAQEIADETTMITGEPSEAAVFDWGNWETATQ